MLKKKEISPTLSSKQWYSQSFGYHCLIKSSSELQIIKKKEYNTHHSTQQTTTKREGGGGRKGGREGGKLLGY